MFSFIFFNDIYLLDYFLQSPLFFQVRIIQAFCD